MSIVDKLLKNPVSVPADKDINTYLILCLLGCLGVHNFWAGHKEKAQAQLIFALLAVPTCGITQIICIISVVKDFMAALEQKKAKNA